MLSRSHGFLFIHIPKTAGNSIQQALSAYSEDEIVVEMPDWQDGIERFELANPSLPGIHKHSTLAEYKDMLEPKLFNDLFKFAVVRNPWDRAVSHFFHARDRLAKTGELEGEAELFDRAAFVEHINRMQTSLDFIGLGGGVPCVDYVVRFENLAQGWREVCDRIGIPFLPLPWHNRGQGREKYARYYDDETRDMVMGRFREEIECFGYSF